MNPLNRIDYNKFKIEVYTPDGQFVCNVPMNAEHVFYCSGLTPGQEYTLVFFYDNLIILCASFCTIEQSKVIYLNPQHFLYNNDVSDVTFKPDSDLAEKFRTSAYLESTYQLWEKMLIDNVMNKKYAACKKPPPPRRYIKFKAGNELATKVK
ncbi:MAG: hypothetical protein PHT69_04235 [Bacteroidales bacterium]|nr:hypothetical protein [Bacteroidales bacterium]